MDSINFHTWLTDFGRKFPAIRDWWRSIAPPSDQDALMYSWQQALTGLDLADCLEANRLMLSGEFEGPGQYPSGWQWIPALIRTHAAAIKALHAPPAPQNELDKREHERNLFVRDRQRRGVPREQISRELVAAGYEGIAIFLFEPTSRSGLPVRCATRRIEHG